MGAPAKSADDRVGAQGEYGAIVNWFHMACARHDDMAVAYAKMGDSKMSKSILGYADMPVELPLGMPRLCTAVRWQITCHCARCQGSALQSQGLVAHQEIAVQEATEMTNSAR